MYAHVIKLTFRNSPPLKTLTVVKSDSIPSLNHGFGQASDSCRTNILFEPMPGDEHKINAVNWAFIPPSSDLITRIPRLSVYKRSCIGDPPLLLTGTVHAQPLERKRKPGAREKRLLLAKATQKTEYQHLFNCSWSVRFFCTYPVYQFRLSAISSAEGHKRSGFRYRDRRCWFFFIDGSGPPHGLYTQKHNGAALVLLITSLKRDHFVPLLSPTCKKVDPYLRWECYAQMLVPAFVLLFTLLPLFLILERCILKMECFFISGFSVGMLRAVH